MANRSHIYTCDEIPGKKDFYARGLSEYNWDIPFVHKLMMAGSPRVVRSALWEHDIGIIANRAGAFERSLAFFDKLGDGELANRSEFDSELAGMKEFLAATPPSKYILMEAGEIFSLTEEDLNAQANRLAAEIPGLVAKVDRALAGMEDKWLASLRKNWEEEARPGWWSDVLYFSFTPPKKSKPAAKKATAKKKKPAAMKRAAKTAKSKPAAATAKKMKKKPAAKKPAAKPAKKQSAKQPTNKTR